MDSMRPQVIPMAEIIPWVWLSRGSTHGAKSNLHYFFRPSPCA